MINLLIKEDNILVFQPKLAKFLGLNEAIILNQIHYWLEKKKHIIEGRPWVYNTYEDWQEQICFLCVSTIKKGIKKLESMEIVIASNFNRSKIDKTKWYTIDYEALQKLYKLKNDKCKAENMSRDKINQMMDKNNQTRDINEPSKRSEIPEEEVGSNRAIPETTTETTTKDKDNNKMRAREDSSFRNLTLFDKARKSGYEVKKGMCFWTENVRGPCL